MLPAIKVSWQGDNTIMVDHPVTISGAEVMRAMEEVKAYFGQAPKPVTIIYCFPDNFRPPLGAVRQSLEIFAWLNANIHDICHVVFVNPPEMLKAMGWVLSGRNRALYPERYKTVRTLAEFKQANS